MNKKELFIETSYYDLEKEILEKIDKIINRYFYDLLKSVELNTVDPSNLVTYALVIGEAFPLFINKEKWKEISYIIMENIKKQIINHAYPKTLALFNGFSEIGFAVYTLNRNTNHYGKFLYSINKLILNALEKEIDKYNEVFNELRANHYDVICGLAGIGNYLLLFEQNNENEEIYNKLLGYLIELSKHQTVEGHAVPRWYIKSQNQYRDDEKIDFPKGNFNFGLAHGIAGPMITLSKAYKNGIVLPYHRQAVESIIEEYKKYSIRGEDGSFYWPTQLKFEDYIKENARDLFRPRKASWCYGNIGISRALYIASKNIGDTETMNFAIENIEKIASMDNEQYFLESPILCHGYAGLLAILNITYKETKSEILRQGVNKVLQNVVNFYDEDSKYGFKNKETVYTDGKIIEQVSEDNSLLEGTSGIILALISILRDKTYYENYLSIN